MGKLEPRWDRSEGSRPASGAQAGVRVGVGFGVRAWRPPAAGASRPAGRAPRAPGDLATPRRGRGLLGLRFV